MTITARTLTVHVVKNGANTSRNTIVKGINIDDSDPM